MRFLVIALLLMSSQAFGKTELEFSFTTWHYFDAKEVSSCYANKAYDEGRGILNPIIGVKFDNTRVFAGLNSVGGRMAGLSYQTKSNWIFGAYLQDLRPFKERFINPVSIYETRDQIGLTPILGYDLNIKFGKYKVFTILTPILLTAGVGISF